MSVEAHNLKRNDFVIQSENKNAHLRAACGFANRIGNESRRFVTLRVMKVNRCTSARAFAHDLQGIQFTQ